MSDNLPLYAAFPLSSGIRDGWSSYAGDQLTEDTGCWLTSDTGDQLTSDIGDWATMRTDNKFYLLAQEIKIIKHFFDLHHSVQSIT